MASFRNQILIGDALTILQNLPDNFVQTCITSPPYYGLRDYGIPGQIGLEETPDEYVTKLVEVFREVRRVLRNDGTLWLNLGDSYAAGKTGRDDSGDNGRFGGPRIEPKQRSAPAGLKPKDLIGIPWLVAFALRADGWYLRSDIIWSKPNAMPESVEDRPTKSHEYLFLLSKSATYYYDNAAIREPHETATTDKRRRVSIEEYEAAKVGRYIKKGEPELEKGRMSAKKDGYQYLGNPYGRNKRSVWTVASQPYPESHFATFPPKLIEPCILAGSRPGDIVLDCFMGAGTVALVSIKHHRDWLGIELNPDYVQLSEKRIATVQQTLWESEAVS